jgi:excisionase family DNA binding protein
MDNQLTVPKFLTVEEVAALLRVSPRSVYDWVSQGVIPFHKAGRRTIFSLDETLEWTSKRSK